MDLTTVELWAAAAVVLTNIFSWLFLRYFTGMDDLAKRIVVATFALVISTAELWYNHRLDTGDWSRTWLVVFLLATGTYVAIWKPLADKIAAGNVGPERGSA